MDFQVGKVYPQFDFTVNGASYAGAPRDNTILYIGKKVAGLAEHLTEVKDCLCFIENGVSVPEEAKAKNGIVFTDRPQYDYAVFANQLADAMLEEERRNRYVLTEEGYYLGTGAVIGADAYIEPGAVIGHHVVIGDRARIGAGAVIKYAVIGDDFVCGENAVIGTCGFTMAKDEHGDLHRIPSMGQVMIGNHVEVGAGDCVARGASDVTILEDHVKIGVLVDIGHEAHLHKNVEITGGCAVSGFAEVEEDAYLGVSACIRNRIKLGSGCTIGMGAVVTKSVESNRTVVGNPARNFEKK